MKVERFEGARSRAAPRWLTLADSIWWVRYRVERPKWDGMAGDLDRPLDRPLDEIGTVDALSDTLVQERIETWGRLAVRGDGESGWQDVYVPIPAIEWTSRLVANVVGSFIKAPYSEIYLERAALRREFPPIGKRKRGRPNDYDWPAIRAMYDVEQKGLTQGSLVDVLLTLCKEKRGEKETPGPTRLKTKIREWDSDQGIKRTKAPIY